MTTRERFSHYLVTIWPTQISTDTHHRQDNTLTDRIHISQVCLLVHYMPSHWHDAQVTPKQWNRA